MSKKSGTITEEMVEAGIKAATANPTRTLDANVRAILEAALALTPAVAPGALSEQERHAVGHARYQVEHATPDNPECCFDYELVATLIGVVDRLDTLAQAQEPGEDKR